MVLVPHALPALRPPKSVAAYDFIFAPCAAADQCFGKVARFAEFDGQPVGRVFSRDNNNPGRTMMKVGRHALVTGVYIALMLLMLCWLAATGSPAAGAPGPACPQAHASHNAWAGLTQHLNPAPRCKPRPDPALPLCLPAGHQPRPQRRSSGRQGAVLVHRGQGGGQDLHHCRGLLRRASLQVHDL